VTTEAQPPSTRSLRLQWPLAAVGVGRGYYRGEPPGAAVAAARRAGSPWPEQMDCKMLRFVEKTRNSHRQNAPSADRSVVSAWGGIEARRPPLPGARWPSRRSPEAAGSPWHAEKLALTAPAAATPRSLLCCAKVSLFLPQPRRERNNDLRRG